MDFAGKTAISTGAASGMGLLFAQNWTELGGNAVLCDVNQAVLEEKVAEINAKGKGKAIGVVCDVRDYSQVCAARDQAVAAFVQSNTFAPGRTADMQMLSRVIDYVQERFHEPLTLEDVARHLGYSYSYVSKQVKQGLGMSFSDFLARCRVSYAQALLGEGETSISQVALQAGFGSIRNFNRVFLRVTGETPRAYQKDGMEADGARELLLALERE